MWKNAGEKCGKLCISSILSSKRDISSTKIDTHWRHLKLTCSTAKQSHLQNFSSICQSVLEKSAENCIYSILSSKRGITPKKTQIDDTQTWSVVQKNKVICKHSAQYVKRCKRKVRKTVYFQYSKFQKGHNSHKHWRKLTTLELDL